MFSLNSMSRESGAGAPLDHFLQRNVRSQLPNASNKVFSLGKELERRKAEQDRWMRRLGRGTCAAYQVGDEVRVQHQATGRWSIKGAVSEVITHDGGGQQHLCHHHGRRGQLPQKWEICEVKDIETEEDLEKGPV